MESRYIVIPVGNRDMPLSGAAARPYSVAIDIGHAVGQPGGRSARAVPESHFNMAPAIGEGIATCLSDRMP